MTSKTGFKATHRVLGRRSAPVGGSEVGKRDPLLASKHCGTMALEDDRVPASTDQSSQRL